MDGPLTVEVSWPDQVIPCQVLATYYMPCGGFRSPNTDFERARLETCAVQGDWLAQYDLDHDASFDLDRLLLAETPEQRFAYGALLYLKHRRQDAHELWARQPQHPFVPLVVYECPMHEDMEYDDAYFDTQAETNIYFAFYVDVVMRCNVDAYRGRGTNPMNHWASLGKAYANRGDSDTAQAMFEKALEVGHAWLHDPGYSAEHVCWKMYTAILDTRCDALLNQRIVNLYGDAVVKAHDYAVRPAQRFVIQQRQESSP